MPGVPLTPLGSLALYLGCQYLEDDSLMAPILSALLHLLNLGLLMSLQ